MAEPIRAKPTATPEMRTSTLGTVRRGLRLLTPVESAGVAGIAVLIVVNGLVETVLIGAVAPLVLLIVDPERLLADPRVEPFTAALGTTEIETLVVGLGAAVCVAIVLGMLLSLATSLLGQRHSATCQNRLGKELMDRCLRAPYVWLSRTHSAEFARQFLLDIRQWRQGFLQSLVMIFQSAILICFPIILVLSVSPLVGSVFLLAIGAIGAVFVYSALGRIRGLGHTKKRESANLLRQITEAFQGIKDIKINNQTARVLAHFDTTQQSINSADVMHKFWIQLPQALVLAIGQIGFVGFALTLWSLGWSGANVVAMTAMLAVVITRVIPAFNRLSGHLGALNHALPFVDGLSDIFSELEQLPEGHSTDASRSGASVPEDWRRIRFEGVSFGYPDAEQDAVSEVSFTLERGKWYGLVGPSGAGKSTLVDLAMGLLSPTSGRILVDEIPLNELNPESWRQRLAYVPQNLLLLDDTLLSNITFGASPDSISSQPLSAVLADAQLDTVVTSLANGLQTRLGERGGLLSGGQAQRVGLARALYRQADLLVLDEATSALDAMTEAAVLGSMIKRLTAGLALIVTHRTGSLRHCDRIFVVTDGRLVANGTYDELYANSALFRRLATEHDAGPKAGSGPETTPVDTPAAPSQNRRISGQLERAVRSLD